MFVMILCVFCIASITADLQQTLEELNSFLEPAALNPAVMAQLGKSIAENEWEEHKQSFVDKIPDSTLFFKHVSQLETALQYAGSQLCEPCYEYVPAVQEFLKNSGLTTYAVEIALCNVFYLYDNSLVPVCDVGLAGLNLYIQNAHPSEICGAIPSCKPKSTKKRSNDESSESIGRYARGFFAR